MSPSTGTRTLSRSRFSKTESRKPLAQEVGAVGHQQTPSVAAPHRSAFTSCDKQLHTHPPLPYFGAAQLPPPLPLWNQEIGVLAEKYTATHRGLWRYGIEVVDEGGGASDAWAPQGLRKTRSESNMSRDRGPRRRPGTPTARAQAQSGRAQPGEPGRAQKPERRGPSKTKCSLCAQLFSADSMSRFVTIQSVHKLRQQCTTLLPNSCASDTIHLLAGPPLEESGSALGSAHQVTLSVFSLSPFPPCRPPRPTPPCSFL